MSSHPNPSPGPTSPRFVCGFSCCGLSTEMWSHTMWPSVSGISLSTMGSASVHIEHVAGLHSLAK